MNKICNRCKMEKNEIDFSSSEYKKSSGRRCKLCTKEYNNIYYSKNKNKINDQCKDYYANNNEDILKQKSEYYIENNGSILKKQKAYYRENKEEIFAYQKKYVIENANLLSEYQKEYRENNKQTLNIKKNIYIRNRLLTDPIFKIKKLISRSVNIKLKNNNSSKNGESVSKYLLYTIAELKEHLEKQFEPWMTWNNHGVYNSNIWDDNNSSTWAWQIDHIIPHSIFKYTSMKDEEFKKCWSLSNLRPYSAKQNILDSNKRVAIKDKFVESK